jgi:hypothetical protein
MDDQLRAFDKINKVIGNFSKQGLVFEELITDPMNFKGLWIHKSQGVYILMIMATG